MRPRGRVKTIAHIVHNTIVQSVHFARTIAQTMATIAIGSSPHTMDKVCDSQTIEISLSPVTLTFQ
eukprot:221102-Amphidinium_carterae.1